MSTKTVKVTLSRREIVQVINGLNTLCRWYRARGCRNGGLVIEDVEDLKEYIRTYLKEFEDESEQVQGVIIRQT